MRTNPKDKIQSPKHKQSSGKQKNKQNAGTKAHMTNWQSKNQTHGSAHTKKVNRLKLEAGRWLLLCS